MMRKQRKRKLLACVLAAAMAFGSTFASAATTVSRYTGSTYTHNAQFDNCIIVDGVDVSAYQETIDWQAAKRNGVDFAILRVAYRGYGAAGNMNEDNCFVKHIEGAKAAGVMVGIYFFSQALNTLEARAEARYTLELLGNYDLDLPIFMDYEFSTSSKGRFLSGTISKIEATENARAFCDYIEENSRFEAGVYANLNFLNKTVDGRQLSQRYPIWVAQYNKRCDYGNAYAFWQYSSGGKVDGMNGRIDSNVWYVQQSPVSTSLNSMVDAQAVIAGNTEYTYRNGQPVTPQVQVSHSGRSLTEGVDYKVRYIGNTEGGTAYAMVMGMGQYTDYTLVPFTIAPSRDLSGFSVKQPTNRVYTGKENKPSSITVKDASGKTLKNGLDYTWTVSNAVEVGTATVHVQMMGNYAGTLETTYQITKSAQSITIGNRKTEVLLGDAPFNLNAVSPAGSALTYKSSNPAVAAVSADGTVTPQAIGETTITVKAAGSADYTADSETFILKVRSSGQTVTTAYTRYKRDVDDSGFNLKAKTDGDGKLSYASDDPSIATIDENGQVTLTGGAGVVHFTVTAAATALYGEGQKIVTLTVNDISDERREEELADLVAGLKLKASSTKTAAGSVKVTLQITEGDIDAIKELGYTVKYKFFRSTYYNKGYQGKINGSGLTYVNTAGTKGTRYYYKARVMVYDEDGSLAAYSKLPQCRYAARIWTKTK